MNFRSFMMEGMDGEFHFESEGGVGDGEGSSPSIRFVNNEASVIDDEPLNSAPPSQFVENIRDSYDALSKKYVVDEARNRKLGKSSKATGKRKQIAKSSGRETSQKARKVPSQASKAFGDPSDPLDVDISFLTMRLRKTISHIVMCCTLHTIKISPTCARHNIKHLYKQVSIL
ncbi:hypothetical protein Tco_1263799 [Tanacetum coccineum]